MMRICTRISGIVSARLTAGVGMADSFHGVIAFAFLASMLLVGTIARARIGWLRSALIPASLVGGVVGFALITLDWSFGFVSEDFTAFTFHFFTLSFMSLCLTGSDGPHTRDRSIVGGGLWLSVIWVMSLVMQALIGLLVIVLYNAATAGQLSVFLGMIVTHGFTQGPGQAVAFGEIWQNNYGIKDAMSFGLIYASLGFVAAFIVGVPVARYFVKRGLQNSRAVQLDAQFLSGMLSADSSVSAGRQITHSASIDSLVFHLSILGVAYLVTDQYLALMQPIAQQWQVGEMNFGFVFSYNLFFFHGLMVAMLMRALMDRFGWGRYIDNETQRRITGSAVDLTVAATLMSIEFVLLWTYVVPIALVCIVVTVATAALCFGSARRLTTLGPERSLAVFGCCCGSTGSGLLLLRILDPELRTPVAMELAFFNIAISVIGFHILTLMAPILPAYDITTIVAVYGTTFAVAAGALMMLNRRMRNT